MKKFWKTLLIIIIIGIVGVGGYFIYTTFFAKNSDRSAFTLIPDDAIFIVETDNLSKAWTTLSSSELWSYLTGTSYFADINEDLQMVDKYLKSNAIADQLLSDRKLVMSAHMTSGIDWDFLYIVDLQGASKTVDVLKGALDQIEGYRVETRAVKVEKDLFGTEIIELIDEANPKEIIYISLVDNVLLVSFTGSLVEKAIKQKETNYWATTRKFQTVTAGMSSRKMFKFYFNYSKLDAFSKTFLTESDEMMKMLGNSLAFSAFEIDLEDEQLSFEGYTNLDSMNSYIKALANVSPGKIRAYDIISNQTAAYMSISFESYKRFYDNLMNEYAAGNPEEAQEMNDGIELVEKLFKIDLEENFFNWIGTEIALVKLRPRMESSREEDVAIAIHANDITKAKKGMGHIVKQIRKRSPLKFEIEPYRNFEISYLERKNFFKLFFGKLFNEMEKPFFTYIEDYVVFSNSMDLLKEIIDDYIGGRTLSHSEKFVDFKDEFDVKSNITIFIQMPKIYETLYQHSPPENREGVEENKELILSFARLGFQLTTDGEMFKGILLAEYDPDAMIDDAMAQVQEKAQSELFSKELDSLSFKIKIDSIALLANGKFKEYYSDSTKIKFEGNIIDNQINGLWRAYYESGNLKSAVTYKNGQVNGIAYFYYDDKREKILAEVTFEDDKVIDFYKEFYESGARKAKIEYDDGQMDGDAEFYYPTGNIKIKGRYKNGKKQGRWLFYDENGEVMSKERWRRGDKK